VGRLDNLFFAGALGQKSQAQDILSQALQLANSLGDEGLQNRLLMDLTRCGCSRTILD
jgi:hypothetical protein